MARLKEFSADSKAAARKPKDSISSVVVLQTDSSSSMIETRFVATANLQLTQDIGRWARNLSGIGWILHPKKDNAGNAFVYEGFSEGP
jgi:hypothetical protein